MTTDSSSINSRVSSITWLGLGIALFAMLIIRQAVLWFYPTLTFDAALWKESLIWIAAIGLIVLVRRGEHLPLTSIGIGTSTGWKSILWGLLTAIVCAAVAVALIAVTHYNGGKSGEALDRLPLWLITLVVIRAGVVEELFYRGYAIERLQALGLNRFAAAAVPLIIFGIGHWTGGWANIVIALALGAVLSGFYLWRRDLVANMIAHFLVDFVGNVLPKLLPSSDS